MPDPLSPEIALSLSAPVLRALLDTFGAPASLGRGSAVDIARALFEERAPAKRARVWAFLERFATEMGRRAFVEAARAVGDARADEWLEMGAADVAAKVAIERVTAKGKARRAIERIADLALLRAERELPERATYELMALAPARPVASAVARTLARGIAEHVHEPWTHEEADGTLHVALFVRAPVTTRVAFARGGLVARHDADVTVDRVRIAADGARVAITMAAPERLLRYAKVLGLSLRPSLTFKPLDDLDAAKLARLALPQGVHGVRFVGLRRRAPDGKRLETRAADALSAAPANDARAGYVDRTTVRVDVGEREADAFAQLPHRFDIADRANDAPVRATCGVLGLFEPGTRPDDARSLAPYAPPDWRWRGVVGDEAFERLVKAKRLVRVQVAHVSTKEHSMHGASYVVRSVPDAPEVEYALAEDRAYGARLVGKDERVAWRLDLDALAREMRADLGATAADAGSAIAIDGVLDLGSLALRTGKLRFVYAMSAPPKGWLATVRRACGVGVTLVVLVPRGHAEGLDGVQVVELDVAEQLGVKRVGRALGRVAEALNVADQVDRWRTCEEDVVVDAATQRVWVGGILVPLSDAPYRFLVYLARSARVVPTKEIGASLSSGSYPDEAARRIKLKVEAQVAEALDGAGVAWDVGRMIVTEGKKGYRLGVTARVF